MKSIGFLLLFTVLYVYAQRKCDAGNECPPGQACRDGICHARLDCPMISMPIPGSGCGLESFIDDKGCPKMKVVCNP
ncbi:hypothetical protein RB195_009101 [Necator americanus]|uniref:CC domain-containing protein n=1 Tax=Necator americanus TaxID=51031 RepID=A0ABR1CRW0_NECAM